MRNVLYLRRTSEHQKESKGHKVIERCEAVPFPPMPVSLTGKSENFPIFQPTLYNQILSAFLPKDVNCIALKCCVIFPFFSLFRSLKSYLGWIILQPLALKRLKLNLESQVQSNLHVLRGTVLSGHPVSNGRFSKSRNLLPFTTVISQLY